MQDQIRIALLVRLAAIPYLAPLHPMAVVVADQIQIHLRVQQAARAAVLDAQVAQIRAAREILQAHPPAKATTAETTAQARRIMVQVAAVAHLP